MGPEQVAHLIQTHLPSRGCVSFSSSGKRGCGGKQEHTSTQGLSHLLCTPRCSNHERRPRPSRSAPACWSTPPPRGSRRWKPAPIASSMNCDVLEPSSPVTAHFSFLQFQSCPTHCPTISQNCSHLFSNEDPNRHSLPHPILTNFKSRSDRPGLSS